MQTRTVEQIGEWQSHPFSGDDLPTLADTSFTGAIEAGDAWLFMLNGRAVGAYGGTVADVAAGEGTAYVAPDPALPLLFTMLERDGEERGRYYTAQTALAAVDETLREGGFTGYVELAENVISGDYYAVYYDGAAMYAAFVGQSERPITGEEAYARAVDEVGIYTVVSTDVPVLDLPDADGATGEEPDDARPSDDADGRVAEAVADVEMERTPPSDSAGADDASAVRDDADAVESTPPSLPDDLPPAIGRAEDGSPEGPIPPVDDAPPDSDPDAASGANGGEDPLDEPHGDDPGDLGDLDDLDGVDDLDDLRTTLRARTAEVERFEGRVRSLTAERDDLRAENESLRDEIEALNERRDRLEASIQRLKERIRELESGGTEGDGSADDDGIELPSEEALAGTNLFVRYRSRGAMTLDDVLDGYDDRDELRRNLDLENHTRFDAEAVRVGGGPFEAFLADTLEYEFVSWLVLDLPFEILDTGYVDAVEALYAAVPEIDRAELRGTVDAGEESPSFDVVCRDRLGNPLIVADLHDARDPTEEAEMESLLSGAERVAEAYDTLVGAFVVTSSFFEPGALELASEATASGGLFGGGKRASFVRLSRKRGFHLCLVEARNRRFHLTVPEL